MSDPKKQKTNKVSIKNKDAILGSKGHAKDNKTEKAGQRRLPVWALIIIDLVLACMVLAVFSYFHFIMEQEDLTEPIAIERPISTPAEADNDSKNRLPENVLNNTGEDAEPVEEIKELTWAEKFSEHFSDTAIATDSSYKSPGISIEITQMTKGEGRDLITYYVADIYLADIEYFQTYFAKDKFGTGIRDSVLNMHKASGALLTISGDYYGNARSRSDGIVIRNGNLYRAEKTKADICVLYYDGTMETIAANEFDIDEAVAKGAWQGWTFGPTLLGENGNPLDSFHNTGPVLRSENPRSGIGYYEPGHYVFVVVDGRQRHSKGATMQEFAEIFADLGCAVAYNLDGGASSMMAYGDGLVSSPSGGGRTISDVLIIAEVQK